MDPASFHRLNQHLALHLGVSRREADTLIGEGRVTVNGTTAILGARVAPEDTVYLNGAPLTDRPDLQYLLFHKPVGYVSSRQQQGETPTLYALLPPSLHHLKPVGRLDKDSSGLLLLTNDGEFAHQMTHPSFHKQKTYEVSLDHDLAPLHHQMVADYGVVLSDGPSKLQLERLADTSRRKWRVLMHEGRNRQIRRTFGALGYTVTRLHRTQFGPYSLGDIPPGSYQSIDISQ